MRLRPDLTLAADLLAQLDGTTARPAPAAAPEGTFIAATPPAPQAATAKPAVATVSFEQLDDDMLKDSGEPSAKIGSAPR
jgi:hypothetical protein